MPVRIQRMRTKGWKMPENTVFVGRRTLWENPFLGGTPRETVKLYSDWLAGVASAMSPCWRSEVLEKLPTLRGKNLACWCPAGARYCHADILLELANK